MLLPPFHGERMRSYDGLIEEEALRAMASWPDDEEFATLPTFNTITLQGHPPRRVRRRGSRAGGARGAAAAAHGDRPAARHGEVPAARPRAVEPRRPLQGDAQPLRPASSTRLIEMHLSDPQLDERIDILALMLGALRDEGEEIDRSDGRRRAAHAARRRPRDDLLLARLDGRSPAPSPRGAAPPRGGGRTGIPRRSAAATILEVQRHRPVISATGRVAVKPFQLGDWLAPARHRVVTGRPVMHDDERFHADATSFDPDRYVGAQARHLLVDPIRRRDAPLPRRRLRPVRDGRRAAHPAPALRAAADAATGGARKLPRRRVRARQGRHGTRTPPRHGTRHGKRRAAGLRRVHRR